MSDLQGVGLILGIFVSIEVAAITVGYLIENHPNFYFFR